MHMHPILPALVASICLILIVGALARRLRQPHVIAYLIVGLFLGPSGLDLFEEHAVALAGDLGVILLLFFVGLEVDLSRLAMRWRVSVAGTLLQIALSVAAVAGMGLFLDWPWPRIVLLGFAISVSSTALVVTMLQQWNELDSDDGHEALGILLIQDVAVVPMMITLTLLGDGPGPAAQQVGLQLAGGIGVAAFVVALVRSRRVALPVRALLRRDHELQVFAAFLLCFAFAWLTGILGLSTPLGAFIAGLTVARARETDWVQHTLEPFRVLLVAAFFVSVGMLIDTAFVRDNWMVLVALVLAALVTNTLINACILHALGRGWRASLYVGGLLSQIGEFSFVLAAVGREAGLVTDFGHQMILCAIAGTLLVGPAWISALRPLRGGTSAQVST